MSPSDMLLRVGTVAGYNNEIVISANPPGPVANINRSTAPPNSDGTVNSMGGPPKHNQNLPPAPSGPAPTEGSTTPDVPSGLRHSDGVPLQDHEDEKRALVVGATALGLLALWLWR